MSTARSVVLKDIDGNECYPKTTYSNIIGLAYVTENGVRVYFGNGAPPTDATQFEDIDENSLYFNTQNIDMANDNIFLYRCAGIADDVITWRPITDYTLEILKSGRIDFNRWINWSEVTSQYAGRAVSNNVYLPPNCEINITLPPRTIIKINDTILGNAGVLTTQYLTYLTDDTSSYTLMITSAISTYSEILESIEIYLSIETAILGDCIVDYSITCNKLSDGSVLKNKIFNTDVLGTRVYGSGSVTYENEILTVNYTGESGYNGGGIKIKLYDGMDTIIQAHLDDFSGFRIGSFSIIDSNGNIRLFPDIGATSKFQGDSILINIPASVAELYGNEVYLMTTNHYTVGGYVVLSNIRILTGYNLDVDDIESNCLGNFLEAIKLPKYINKKILFLGDSVTAGSGVNNWVEYFNKLLSPSLSINVASGGSRYCDYEDTIYDGNPGGGGENHNNVIGNQVEKIWRGKDPTHPDYSKVDNYQEFDIIMIAAGSNDSMSSFDADIEPAFTHNWVPVNLSNVDRTTFAGAFRYAVETLQRLYPNAKIFICTPIQAVDTFRNYTGMNVKRNYLKELSNRISVEYIDTFECGICSIYETWGGNGRDLRDGLHPNSSGAKKIAKYNAKNVINKYI